MTNVGYTPRVFAQVRMDVSDDLGVADMLVPRNEVVDVGYRTFKIGI